MFIRMVENSMSSLTYSAKLAGLNWEIINDKNGITVSEKNFFNFNSIV